MIAGYVGRWSQAQMAQLQLCANIDQLAKRLPVRDVDASGDLAARLVEMLIRLHAFEEDELFPVLEAMSPHMRPLLVTFRSHHARDRLEAATISEMLLGSSRLSADGLRTLKDRLEAFAETLRRHIQFEEAITMALFASRRVDEKSAVQ